MEVEGVEEVEVNMEVHLVEMEGRGVVGYYYQAIKRLSYLVI